MPRKAQLALAREGFHEGNSSVHVSRHVAHQQSPQRALLRAGADAHEASATHTLVPREPDILPEFAEHKDGPDQLEHERPALIPGAVKQLGLRKRGDRHRPPRGRGPPGRVLVPAVQDRDRRPAAL